MAVVIEAIFVGSLRPLPPEGQPTGIFKTPVAGPVGVASDGLIGDEHGDRRVHGGPEKAVHYFAAENYPRLAQALADRSGTPGAGVPVESPVPLHPGILGENLSGHGMVESDVCLGDVYAIGTARLQLSQPRRPCWRIDNRLDRRGANQVVTALGCPGWYYRVIQDGEITVGDRLELIERNDAPITVARLLEASAQHRPDPGELRKIAATPGLNDDWVGRLIRRAQWLETNQPRTG